MKKQFLENKLWDIIKARKKELDSLRPLPANAVKKLSEKFEIEMTYNSNAIEGNSLTLKETFLVITEGITIKGKSLKDHLEAKGHKEALDYLIDFVEKKDHFSFSERIIFELHDIIMHEIKKEWSGKYRNSNVFIMGSDHTPPDALLVKDEMSKLVQWVKKERKTRNIIELASILHHKFVYIHPFFDGNGRAARLIMNLILLQEGYPIVIILKNDRAKYYNVLQQADKGDYAPLVRFVAQAVMRSLDIYLDILRPTTSKREKLMPLSQIARSFPYSEKYLNLLARGGKLEAHKEGRIWVTSKEAVERYINERERKRKI